MSREICYHPHLVPTQWNQPRPEPTVMHGCDCGANMSCSVCGWGRGSWPCECNRSAIDEYRAGETTPLSEFIDELKDEGEI